MGVEGDDVVGDDVVCVDAVNNIVKKNSSSTLKSL